MGLFDWLFGKKATPSLPGIDDEDDGLQPSSVQPVTGPPEFIQAVDELINAWRGVNAKDGRPWALFEHGTCVYLTNPEPDPYSQAVTLMTQWGRVYPGSSFGDFDVRRLPGGTGWLVTCHHPDIVTLVGVQVLEEQHRRSGEQSDLTVGLLGRSLRDRDAIELGIVHIEDKREPANQVNRGTAAAWADLVRRAQQAKQRRSNWQRFAIPLEGIAVLSGADADCPPRSLDAISMPPEVRAHIEALESIVRQAGRLPQAVTVWSGLQLGNMARSPNQSQPSFEQVFAAGQLVELRGILSGSAVIEPPLYAGGMQGALLEIEIHSAANMSLMMPREGEEEYLLPRDCRCRIMAVEPSKAYVSQDENRWSRPTVRLQQL